MRRPPPPPGHRYTDRPGRPQEIELIDPPCPQHGDPPNGRSWAACADPDHSSGRAAGHNLWRYPCGRRLHLVGDGYVEAPACVR